MINFTHETTRYTVKPENAQGIRDLLAKPKKHKCEAFKPIRRDYPQFIAGMSTSDYVALFNLQFTNVQHKIVHECSNYHRPAPMLDASTPECVEDVNPDYVYEPKRKKATATDYRRAIVAALDLLAKGDSDSAQYVLNEVLA